MGWSIAALEAEADARTCARIMAGFEPWLWISAVRGMAPAGERR
jgi:hypothetical protein